MKKRYYFGCGRRLDFYDYLNYNLHQDHSYLTKLWKIYFIELYCCECYKGGMLKNRGIIYFPDQKEYQKIITQNLVAI